ILREVCVGILLACATQMCMGVTVFAGSVVDMMTGLSMVTMMDPMSMESVATSSCPYSSARLPRPYQ
ncbi:MAG: flagellar biosynthetic protein FliR, partial [Lachnospiraceae bacterium]|nr:flagellar biosynthetic protein FliR [Lachnospiraceae bacterium]